MTRVERKIFFFCFTSAFCLKIAKGRNYLSLAYIRQSHFHLALCKHTLHTRSSIRKKKK